MARPVLVRLVGSFSVVLDGEPLLPSQLGSLRGRLLLELLSVERSRSLNLEQITGVLWPVEPPAQAAAGVATLVSRLRQVLGHGVIQGARGTYRLGARPDIEVDLDQAAALLGEAERRTGSAPGLAVSAAERAITMLGSGVLADRQYDDWAEPARQEHATLLRRGRLVAARALIDTGAAAAAVPLAAAVVAVDRLDEAARRALMTAYQSADQPAQALASYEDLRRTLREEIGIDPAHATQDLYLAILRAEPPGEPKRQHHPTGQTDGVLRGRSSEVAALHDHWCTTVAGTARTVVLVGESGIGKTRLAEEIAAEALRTGGTVLRTRCYEAERSLFLQPVLDALEGELGRIGAAALAELAGDDAATLAGLMPMLAPVLGVEPTTVGSDSFRRRRCFEAVTALLARLSHRAPVLLLVDDLHNAGRSTLELLHFLTRHAPGSRVLTVATARVEESQGWRRMLDGVVTELEVGPLDRAAVQEFATDAGQAGLADRIMTLTSGHTLYVVEVLRSLAVGSSDVPLSLQATVLDRVRRMGADGESLLRAAAVLGTKLEPAVLASLVGLDAASAVGLCERALSARLLVVAGKAYEFAHDVVKEVLYASTPQPTRYAYHRRLADSLTSNPEAVALHAAATEDWTRASRAWLLAAEIGISGLAALDAAALATQALEAAIRADQPDLQARALLMRGRAREVAADYGNAKGDLDTAVEIARSVGDHRLQMLALRELGGDVPTALGLPAMAMAGHLGQALKIAESLADRAMQADLLGRLAVLSTNRLRFREALSYGERAVTAARACNDPRALAMALDGRKTGFAYLGEITAVTEVTTELEPLLRHQRDLARLQWVVFESSFVPLAAGQYGRAETLMQQALEINRASGYLGYRSWFVSHLGWAARLRGDLASAVEQGWRSVRLADELSHAWLSTAAVAILATTLLEVGETSEAVSLLERTLPVAEATGAEAYLLRCLAPLALATGSAELLDRADALLAGIDCPPGSAWLLGADAYLCIARAWLERDPGRAVAVLKPLVTAATRIPWLPLLGRSAPVLDLAAMNLQRRGARSSSSHSI